VQSTSRKLSQAEAERREKQRRKSAPHRNRSEALDRRYEGEQANGPGAAALIGIGHNRGPPIAQSRGPARLLDRHEILAITNVTYPTVWAWMRAGTFPRSRIVGGKSMWLGTEIEHWLATLPVRRLKGDADAEEARQEKAG
jgi:predicted DNA-binding transcriptional regulator AlpA